MKLREIKVKNFRGLADVSVHLEDTTVLIGANNSGKTAFLDAIKLALPRSVSGRPSFDEYDYHMARAEDSPQTSDGIVIELWFREDKPDEWPEPLMRALNEIIQTDPIEGTDSIGLRLSSKYEPMAKELLTNWEFLASDGQPLGGRGARQTNLPTFLSYVRVFYLSALRDSASEFSPRSQLWGRILRDLKITEAQSAALKDELATLNDTLLNADPRLEQVRSTLSKIQKVMASAGSKTSIQALPLQHWELMSKAEVVIKGQGSDVNFPLMCHGQGIQSLAVLFLFQAYIDVLLKPAFRPETVALLALEEPEAHLHPHAARALAANFDEIKSQKIISSHSPYFIQEIPLKQIRMFRRRGVSTKVLYLKRSFSVTIPPNDALREFCAKKPSKFHFYQTSLTLTVYGMLEKEEYRELLACYPSQTEIHARLKSLFHESQIWLSDQLVEDLYTYAKRIRGELFFARGWLLCEGQSDYLVLQYFAEVLGSPLDQAGITIIDFQNNGSVDAFVRLAQTYEMPWIIVCDNDGEGKQFVNRVKGSGLPNIDFDDQLRPLPGENMDLELFLIQNGFANEYLQILGSEKTKMGKKQGDKGFEEELAARVRSDKVRHTIDFISLLRAKGINPDRIPQYLAKAITEIRAKALAL